MKKMTILAMILVLAIALTACGGDKAPETTAATVAATAPVETAPVAQPLSLTSWNMGYRYGLHHRRYGRRHRHRRCSHRG